MMEPVFRPGWMMLHQGFRINDYLPTDILVHLALDQGQPENKRWAALMGLSGQDSADGFEVIRGAVSSENPDMRRYGLEALSRHPLALEAKQEIVAMLFDVDDLVRQAACKICGVLEIQEAHDGILQFLKSENPEVRDIAMNTLGLLWRESDFDTVFDIHQSDPSRSVRIAAAKTLRSRATPVTWRALFEVWREDREVRHRLWSCELAGEYGSAQEVHALRPMLRDGNLHVRRAAQRSLEILENGGPRECGKPERKSS